MEIYTVTGNTEHGCCHSAMVINSKGEIICECPDTEMAELICKLLNQEELRD